MVMKTSRTRARLLLILSLSLSSCEPQAAPDPSAPVPAPVEATPWRDAYQRALELEAAGRLDEARSAVEQAIAAGAGRDATLLAAKLAILRDELDAAAELLAPLADDAQDALVQYNLGLIAQRRGQYNDARARYLAATRADPNHAPARFNLAILTWSAGATDEARHHARRFLELSPDDPQADALRRQVGLDPSGALAPTGVEDGGPR
ncbi:MAG: tetratricopeptide repeat protein [Nannocystaceae bacterium]